MSPDIANRPAGPAPPAPSQSRLNSPAAGEPCMRTRFSALVWKYLHEQKWAAASAAAIALFFPVSLLTRDSADVWFAVIAALVYYPLIGGIFFGMRAAAGERAHRTAAFASALPATPLVLGAAKLAAAMVAALVPTLALALLG